jgi:hypothetical protein
MKFHYKKYTCIFLLLTTSPMNAGFFSWIQPFKIMQFFGLALWKQFMISPHDINRAGNDVKAQGKEILTGNHLEARTHWNNLFEQVALSSARINACMSTVENLERLLLQQNMDVAKAVGDIMEKMHDCEKSVSQNKDEIIVSFNDLLNSHSKTYREKMDAVNDLLASSREDANKVFNSVSAVSKVLKAVNIKISDNQQYRLQIEEQQRKNFGQVNATTNSIEKKQQELCELLGPVIVSAKKHEEVYNTHLREIGKLREVSAKKNEGLEKVVKSNEVLITFLQLQKASVMIAEETTGLKKQFGQVD